MKKLSILLFTVLLLTSLISPAFAAEESQIIYLEENSLENGLTVITEITENSVYRSTDKAYTNTKTIKDGETVVAVIAITATFRYDGYTVSVVAKGVTRSDTYNGWNYVQNSFTSSGGTVTLDAKITKWLIFNTPFTMTLSCDKNGKISYS